MLKKLLLGAVFMYTVCSSVVNAKLCIDARGWLYPRDCLSLQRPKGRPRFHKGSYPGKWDLRCLVQWSAAKTDACLVAGGVRSQLQDDIQNQHRGLPNCGIRAAMDPDLLSSDHRIN